MENVEIRDRRQMKTEQRPKPVLGSSELDYDVEDMSRFNSAEMERYSQVGMLAQSSTARNPLTDKDPHGIMCDVRAEQGYSILFDNKRQDPVIAECNNIKTNSTECSDCNKKDNVLDGSSDIGLTDRYRPVFNADEIDNSVYEDELLDVLDPSCVLRRKEVGSVCSYRKITGVLPEKIIAGPIGNVETALNERNQQDSIRVEFSDISSNEVEHACFETNTQNTRDNVSVTYGCSVNDDTAAAFDYSKKQGCCIDFDESGITVEDKIDIEIPKMELRHNISDASRCSTNEKTDTDLNEKEKEDAILCSKSEPVNNLSEASDDLKAAFYEINTEGNMSDAPVSNNLYENVAVINSRVTVGDHIDITNPSTDIPIRTITLPGKKDVHKAGYLQKQGGVDRNQGWKRRWFTFDGKALKYYRDQKSSMSLRMIPVALMRAVAPINENGSKSRSSATVTDLFSASGRQHQFTLECKQRTFLFGTDSIENCQQWQSSLMAAIIEYQKSGIKDILYGGEMNSPDISGLVKFENCKVKYFVALKGEILRYYHNLEDYSIDCPIHELSMTRTRVKEIRKTVLQLDSPPDQMFVLQFDLETEAIQWKTYIETAILRALGDDKVLKRVWEKEENRTCADCSSPDAEWASINIGIVICTKCAGPHRSLGVKRSKVRSLRMDNLSKENENILQVLEAIGNKNGNQFWFKNSENIRMIDGQTPAIVRQKHIEEKYVKKKFADLLQFNNKEELNMTLYSAVKANTIIAAMTALFSGADINFKCPGQSKSVLDVANEADNEVLKEFLELNRYTDVAVLRVDNTKDNTSTGTAKKTALYHEGYLDKTGPNLRGYLKRWCVLHYGRITYFNDKQGLEKGFVDLADAASVSIVTGQRHYSFDINIQTKNRTYRFAAKDEKSLGQWLGVIIQEWKRRINMYRAYFFVSVEDQNLLIGNMLRVTKLQVISPFDLEGLDHVLVAGYFYFKKQLTFWAKVWLVLQQNALHIRHRDVSAVQTIDISRRMKCQQYNLGKHSDKTDDVIKQLDSNQSIELISPEGHVVAYLQGMTLKDTRKMFSLLEYAITGKS